MGDKTFRSFIWGTLGYRRTQCYSSFPSHQNPLPGWRKSAILSKWAYHDHACLMITDIVMEVFLCWCRAFTGLDTCDCYFVTVELVFWELPRCSSAWSQTNRFPVMWSHQQLHVVDVIDFTVSNMRSSPSALAILPLTCLSQRRAWHVRSWN